MTNGQTDAPRSELMLQIAALLLNAAASANYSALTITISEIAADLGVSTAEETWLPDAFLIALVCVTPLTARLLATLGQRRLISISVWGTIGASIATAATQRFDLLIGLMFVQGLFAAPLPPATHALISTRLPFARQGRGMAAWTAGTMSGFLLGSIIGGEVAQRFGWRWIALIGIPFALAGLVAAHRALASEAAARREPDEVPIDAPPSGRTDWLGAALLLTALLCAAAALDLMSEVDPAYAGPIRILAAVAAVAAIGFALHYRRVEEPILDLSTFRDGPLRAAATMNFLVTATSTGIFITVMLGTVAAIDAETMGLLAALRGVALLVGIGLAPLLLGATERYAATASIGLAIASVGKLGFLSWDADTSFAQAAIPGSISSFGLGIFSTALAVMAVATIDKARAEAASSLFVFAGVSGSAIGVAVLGAFRAWRQAALTAVSAPSPQLTSFRELFGVGLLVAIVLVPLPLLARRSARASTGDQKDDRDS